jgi:hypothetical protein
MYAHHINQHRIYRDLTIDEVEKELPSMLLTFDGVAKIVDDVLTESHGEVFGSLPKYKYFLVKFEQYHTGLKRVCQSHSNIFPYFV